MEIKKYLIQFKKKKKNLIIQFNNKNMKKFLKRKRRVAFKNKTVCLEVCFHRFNLIRKLKKML